MAKLVLSAEQQSAILRAAYPLAVADKTVFTRRVIEELGALPELDDGVIYRVCRSIQRELFMPPDDKSYLHNARPWQLKIG